MKLTLLIWPTLLVASLTACTPSLVVQAPAKPIITSPNTQSSATETAEIPILVTPTPSGLTLTPNPLLILAQTSVGGGTGVQITPANPAQPPLIRVQVHGSYSPAFGGEGGSPLTPNGFGVGPLHGGEVLQVLDGGQWVTFARYE